MKGHIYTIRSRDVPKYENIISRTTDKGPLNKGHCIPSIKDRTSVPVYIHNNT